MTDTRSDLPGSTIRIVIPEGHSMVGLLGARDELLQVIERELSADIHVRGNEITVSGPPAETALAGKLFSELLELQRKGTELTPDAIERAVGMLRDAQGVRPADVLTQGILSARGRTISPKTLNQKTYVDAIDKHTIVFSIGPAGTGKTYLAMAMAVKALQAKEVNRIILTRPAVEAGRAARVPARHAVREDRSVPAAAVRRPARHGRRGVGPEAHVQRRGGDRTAS